MDLRVAGLMTGCLVHTTCWPWRMEIIKRSDTLFWIIKLWSWVFDISSVYGL